MTFQELLEQNDYSTRSYSGRGMFDRAGLGVVCDNPVKTALEIGLMIPMNKIEPWNYKNTLNINWDCMGRDYIIYWPFIPYEEKEKEGELVNG